MTEGLPFPFTPEHFGRTDESDDSLFYQQPRRVMHIDEQAIDSIGELFRDVFAPDKSAVAVSEGSVGADGPAILDLLSSWRSHWPRGLPKSRMVGLGLNAVEMEKNPDLDEHIVHDVNKDPTLPFEDGTFDGVVISVSIQYLTRPIEVFKDVNRVLKPGAPFVVTFSNRMFFTKAVRIWTLGDDEQHMRIVATYFHHAGNYEDIRGTCRNPDRGTYDDPLYVVMARKGGS